MTLHIDIPASLEADLRSRLGDELPRNATEALAVEWYRQRLISHGQFAEMLGISRYEADGMLKQHKVLPEADVEQFDREMASLRERLSPER
jgi:predicted HTH domain antitoxin